MENRDRPMEPAGRDRPLGTRWQLFPSAAVAAGIVAGALFFALLSSAEGILFSALIAWIVTVALLSLINYKLIMRMAVHQARERRFRAACLERLRSMVHGRGMAIEGEGASSREGDQLPADPGPMTGLTAALTVLPLLGFVFEALTLRALEDGLRMGAADLASFADRVGTMARVLGVDVPVPRVIPGKRRFALYMALSIVLMPFIAYWYQSIMLAMDQHSSAQADFEEVIVKATGEGKTR
jgi:hypothetical protein